jgi:hypothetical protein
MNMLNGSHGVNSLGGYVTPVPNSKSAFGINKKRLFKNSSQTSQLLLFGSELEKQQEQ